MTDGICYIVGAGEDYGLDFALQKGDLLIAADGGYARVEKAGFRPDLIIGDFDSLGRIPQADRVITLPTVKDVTDTWAAISLGKERGYRRFYLYGCTGGRIDHTLANVQSLAALAEAGMQGVLVDKSQIITAVSCGTLRFDASAAGYLSVFAVSECCTGVTLRGLKYELDDARLTSSFPLGVSNEFLGIPAEVTVKSGTAVIVADRLTKFEYSGKLKE